jgi:hypothetical protein
VVEVVAGTSPYAVRLATTRRPSGEDQATLQPGQTAVLHTGDVAYGETIDGRLEYTALDGSGVTFVDELVEYSFTRPTKEDCDAIAAPSSTGSASSTSSPDSAAPTTSAAATHPSSTGGGTPTQGAVVPTVSTASAVPQQVTAGDSVTVQASGFQPGELVTVQLQGSDAVLATVTAESDGTVRTDVRIPDGTGAGATTVHLTGTQSEVVADVDLQVAAAETTLTPSGDAGDIVPLVAAAVALVAAAGYLFSVVGRRRGHRPTIRRA